MAVTLLVNHIEAGIKLTYNWQNNTSTSIQTIENEDNYRFPFLQTYNPRQINLDVTLICGMKDIFMQYGMLLAASTNAFISLLTFTIQCNLNAACIKQRCADVMKSPTNNTQRESDVEVKPRGNEIFEQRNEQEASQQRNDINAKIKSNVVHRIIKISNLRMQKRNADKRPTGFLVMSHWLVPFLVTGILYFAEYNDMDNVQLMEDTKCIFESNFPMYDFDTFSNVNDNSKIIKFFIHMTPLEHNYFVNEKLNKSHNKKPSNAEINEIVSKVQSIVRIALSYTRNSTENTETANFSDTPESQNLTNSILMNNIVKYIRNITNIDNTADRLNSTLIDQDIDNISEELDVTTSENLSSVSRESAENKNDSYQDGPQVSSNIEENMTQMTVNVPLVQNISISNNQIYNEIMKRIQAANVYSTAKNHHNRTANRYKDRNQFERSDSNNYTENYAEKRKPNVIKDLFSNRNDTFNHYFDAEIRQSGTLHVTNECLVSIKFLKLYLLILFFAIYFLPILFSCILQMRGKHICKNILEILRSKADFTFMDKRILQQDLINKPSTSKKLKDNHDKMNVDLVKKDQESYRENESIVLEIDCMVRIFNISKLSLILCIILWTPVFLGTLLRVFSCTHAPKWLSDLTFLSGVSFGIVRNVLNIYIIKIQETCSDANMKKNRIHPIE
ncbi:hypothetical protein P5V15_008418 [Pogonomyrmex californicus]